MNLADKDKACIWHPFTPQKSMPAPLAIVKGKDSLLYDESGKSYIDAISSWWVTIHGHAHPYIAEKIYEQALTLEQVIFAGFTHKPAVTLAERLLPLLPGPFSRIFYSDNGSTATEVALKMALQYWWNQGNPQRKKVVAFKNAYHGDTFGAMSVSDRGVFTLAFHDLLFEVLFVDTPTPDNLAATCSLLAQQGEQIAAFIYEPLVQGAGGMQMYDATLMNQLLAAAKAQEIICIADEVMTGFGRTGRLFASAYMNITPDIICLSKGLTGGTMALGVTACTPRIYEAYLQDDKLKTFFHGHSFTANPLACTAAVASLHLLQENNSMQQVQWISNSNTLFAEQLRQLPAIKNIRTQGTILAFEMEEGKDEYLNTISNSITSKSMERGVYLRPLGNTVYIMPPYCITARELDTIYDTIKIVVSDK